MLDSEVDVRLTSTESLKMQPVFLVEVVPCPLQVSNFQIDMENQSVRAQLNHTKRHLPGQPHSLTQQLMFVAEPLCAGLLHIRGNPLVYFSLEVGFGCYQVGADQYQTHVCLVNRQLAAHQAALSVR